MNTAKLYTESCNIFDSTFKNGVLTLVYPPTDNFESYISELDSEYEIFSRTQTLHIQSDSMTGDCEFLKLFKNLEHLRLDGTRFFNATIPISLNSVTITNSNTNKDIFNNHAISVENIIIHDDGKGYVIYNSDRLKSIVYQMYNYELDQELGYFDYREQDEQTRKTILVKKLTVNLPNLIHRIIKAEVIEGCDETKVVFTLGENLFVPKMWYITDKFDLIFQSPQEPRNIKLLNIIGDEFYFRSDNNFKFILSWNNSLKYFIDSHCIECTCEDKNSCLELRKVDIVLDKEGSFKYLSTFM